MNRCCLSECENLVMESSKVGACEVHEEFVLELHTEESMKVSHEEERWSDYKRDVKEGIEAGNVFE